MSAHAAITIVDQLHIAGLHLSLAPAGGLAVAPASQLTADLRDLIRNSKAMLVDWLTSANEAISQSPANPMEWKELASAYYVHHFSCPNCIAAGRGNQYGRRCDVGTALWRIYSD